MNTTNTKTFRLRVSSRANELFGAIDYTLTQTLTERDGGVQVETVAKGTDDGARVDEKHTEFYAGVAMEHAVAYRLRNGYTEVR